jgi:hypothetical protein
MSFKDTLNKANPQNLADGLRQAGLGDVVRALPTYLRKKASVAGAPGTNYNLATVAIYALPPDAKAASILRCTTRAGSAGVGEMTPQTYGTTPATTQCAVTPNGDIAFVVGDLPTDFDLLYVPEKGESVELFLDCAASVATLPSWVTTRGVVLLTEAEAITGAVVGKKAVLVPGAGGPATLQARLNLAKSTVTFNNGTDAVTKCRVKLLIASATDLDALLQSAEKY